MKRKFIIDIQIRIAVVYWHMYWLVAFFHPGTDHSDASDDPCRAIAYRHVEELIGEY